mmetsp:Transcript_1342/g.3668  ORF Transcript_1342/g.3668 Transcript_1342/m.3668 type:complete len:212 (-) Transcript_1342:118-753(-)
MMNRMLWWCSLREAFLTNLVISSLPCVSKAGASSRSTRWTSARATTACVTRTLRVMLGGSLCRQSHGWCTATFARRRLHGFSTLLLLRRSDRAFRWELYRVQWQQIPRELVWRTLFMTTCTRWTLCSSSRRNATRFRSEWRRWSSPCVIAKLCSSGVSRARGFSSGSSVAGALVAHLLRQTQRSASAHHPDLGAPREHAGPSLRLPRLFQR